MEKNLIFIKITLVILTIGVWIIVFQNLSSEKKVFVDGGYLRVTGEVNIPNKVYVDVQNEVEVDLRKVNGWNAANHYEYTIQGEEFHSLGVR